MQNLDSITQLSADVAAKEKELDAARVKRAKAMKRAKDARWTYSAIGAAAGMTHKAVQQAIATLEPGAKAKAAAVRRAARASAKSESGSA